MITFLVTLERVMFHVISLEHCGAWETVAYIAKYPKEIVHSD